MAGALAVSAGFTATDADALFLDGVFDIKIYNFEAPQSDVNDRRASSFATQANIDAAVANSGSYNLVTDLDVVYDGILDFNLSGTDQTIGGFFGTGTGSFSGLDIGANTLSADSYNTTTLFKITASSLRNISDMSQITLVTHDDGITLTDGTNTVASPQPTTAKPTPISGLSGTNFELIYAAANGNPSVLEVSVVPLPAAAWLLLGVSGALVAAKRRSARRDA
jgi:hypothetical protein